MDLDPKHAGVFKNWGVLLGHQGHLVEAMAKFRKAVALAPNYVNANNNLGKILIRLNRQVEAVELAENALGAGIKLGDLGSWPCEALQKVEVKLMPEAYHRNQAAQLGCR